MPTPTGRKERRESRMKAVRDISGQQRVRVLPGSDDMRKFMAHPVSGLKFPESGSVEWPLDAFTKRRLQDGSVVKEIQATTDQSPELEPEPELHEIPSDSRA